MPEAIPELVLIVGLFFAVVGYLTARGLLATWTHSLGFVFQWLGTHLRVPIPAGFRTFHIDLGGPFRAVDSWAVSALQNWCDGAEIQMGYCLHGMRKVALYTAQAIDFLARETGLTLEWIEHVRLPKWAKWAATAALPAALLAKIVATVVAKIRPELHKGATIVEKVFPTRVIRIVRHAGAIALPSPWAFPHFRRSWRELEAWRHLTAKRLARLEALLAASGLALAVAKLWGVKPSCLRRGGNIGRFMRGICGLDRALLDLLLLGSIEAFIATDLCDFSDLLIAETRTIRPALMEFVDVENALIGCHGNTAPNRLTLPPVSLPPLVNAVSLAA